MRKKLLIAIPTLDYIHYRFVECLTNLTKYLSERNVDYDVCFEGGTLVYISRDNLAKKAINGKYERVLWLDADMIFDTNVYDMLLNTGKDFISAQYRGRHGKCLPCEFEHLIPPIRSTEFKKGIYRIEGCGFGCVLIKTDILKNVKECYDTCFAPNENMGEDLMFCKRAIELGNEIWGTDLIQAGHITQRIIRPKSELDENV